MPSVTIIRGKLLTLAPGKLSINLAAIQLNWQLLAKKTPSQSNCGAVVKANAYGLGVEAVAPALYEVGCRVFFVSCLDEGIQLRTLLPIEADIVVLHGVVKGEEQEFLSNRLRPVLVSLPMAERWRDFLLQQSMSLDATLKINTGMNRLGLELSEAKSFAEQNIDFFKNNISCVMSHLACAEDGSHPLNKQQLERFCDFKNYLAARHIQPKYSLSNSSGIFLGEAWHFDLLRPGAALYGVNPNPDKKSPMHCVVNLELRVLQVRKVKEGESIGYGASYVANKEKIVAIVAGGYADGLLRSLSSSGHASWGEYKLPFLGRVSMDAIVVDLSEVFLNGEILEEGDYLQVLGEQILLDEQAASASTIGYELLTQLGQRFERVYFSGEDSC